MEGGLLVKIFKGDHQRTIPAKFGLVWLSNFREEDLNVKVYDRRQEMANAHSLHIHYN
jgi:hypothetical protein